MADHIFDTGETAAAFRYASTWWRSIVGAIDDHQWDGPGLGEWTVRELVAHGDRAYKTIIDYLDDGVKDPTEVYSAASYFRIVLAEQTPHVHIAARARKEAAEVVDWLAETDELGNAAERLVSRRPGDTPVHTFVGEMHLDQYLATRVVELVVHGLDLSHAIGLPTSAPPAAARVALTVLLDLCIEEELSDLLRLLTGRDHGIALRNILG